MSQSERFTELAKLWEGPAVPNADQSAADYFAEIAGGLAFAVHDEVAELRDAMSLANGTALKAHARIDHLADNLQPCPELPVMTTLEAIKSEPTIRVRISHAFTAKNGWVCDATTVEWSGEGEPDWKTIERELSHCHYYGGAEADARNRPGSKAETDGNE